MTDHPALLTVPQAARYLGVDPTTLQLALREGSWTGPLPRQLRRGRGHRVFSRAELDDWLRSPTGEDVMP